MNYKSTRICFITAISIIGLLHTFFEIMLWWLVLPCTIYLALIVYGSAIIQANFFSDAYCYANTSEKVIAPSKSLQGFKNELNQTAGSVFKIIGKRMKFLRKKMAIKLSV
jgi:hypothetical protein